MLALLSVWISLASLFLALLMLLYRPAMTDLSVLLVTYFGSPAALCLGLVVLWAHRKSGRDDPNVTAQRAQAAVAIVLAILAAAIVYALFAFAQRVPSPSADGARP
jgi:phosphate/sulfate permease